MAKPTRSGPKESNFTFPGWEFESGEKNVQRRAGSLTDPQAFVERRKGGTILWGEGRERCGGPSKKRRRKTQSLRPNRNHGQKGTTALSQDPSTGATDLAVKGRGMRTDSDREEEERWREIIIKKESEVLDPDEKDHEVRSERTGSKTWGGKVDWLALSQLVAWKKRGEKRGALYPTRVTELEWGERQWQKK